MCIGNILEKLFEFSKNDLVKILSDEFSIISKKAKELINDKDYLENVLEEGAIRANEIAEKNIKEIKKIMGFKMIDIFLPIAGVEINVIFLLFSGLLVGFMSGLFGVGGGFLMTPILIFMGIPPATAVGTEANHILGSSVSGAIAHGRKKNIDYEIGLFLLIGGIFGSHFGSGIFKFLRESGNIDLIISLMYIIFLAVIGTLMLIESSLSIIRKGNVRLSNKRKRNISHYLPLKYKFKQSKIYVSILVPVVIGAFVGILSALMGVGGGFVMVPAMIYLPLG